MNRVRILFTAKTLLIATTTVVLVSFVACRARHDTEAYYAHRIDAERAGEFSRGWLPDFLPNSSHSIRLTYDVSPSKEWCAFDFEPTEAPDLIKQLVTLESKTSVTVPAPGDGWWPEVLTGKVDAKRLNDSGMRLYVITRKLAPALDETIVFAIDKNKGRAYLFGH